MFKAWSYPMLVNETNKLTEQIHSIIQDKKRHIDTTGKIASFFQFVNILKSNYNRIFLSKQDDIAANHIVINSYDEQIKQMFAAFSRKRDFHADKIREEFRGRYELTSRGLNLIILTSRCIPDNGITKDQVAQSPIFKTAKDELEPLLAANNIEKVRLSTEIKKYEKLNKQYENDIRFIDAIQQLVDNFRFNSYCNQLFDSYNDVIYITNVDNRLYQATVNNNSNIYTKKFLGSSIRIEDDFIHTNNLFDIFDEDFDYYYGIYNGRRIFSRKTNCVILSPPGPMASLDYFVINNTFISNLLLNDLDKQQQLKLVVFEKPIGVFVTKKSFDVYSFDEFGVSRRLSDIERIDEFELVPVNFIDFNTLSYRSMNKNIIDLYFRELIKHLRSRISFHKTKSLMNMKYLFGKSGRCQIELYRKIESYLFEHGQSILGKSHKAIIRIPTPFYQGVSIIYPSLINLFIPEIKFLLQRMYIPNQAQLGWANYVAERNKPIDTSPKFFLQYLLNVVLSNLVKPDIYNTLLTKLDGMMNLLITNLAKPDENERAVQLLKSQQIDRVIKDIIFPVSFGGKITHKSKHKISKKKNTYNKKYSKMNK